MDDYRAKDLHKAEIEKLVQEARREIRQTQGTRVAVTGVGEAFLEGDWIEHRLNAVVVYDSDEFGDTVMQQTIPTASVVAVDIAWPQEGGPLVPTVRRDLEIRAAIVRAILYAHGRARVAEIIDDADVVRRLEGLDQRGDQYDAVEIDGVVDDVIDRLCILEVQPRHREMTIAAALGVIAADPDDAAELTAMLSEHDERHEDEPVESPIVTALAVIRRMAGDPDDLWVALAHSQQGPGFGQSDNVWTTRVDALDEDIRDALFERLALVALMKDARLRFRPYMRREELVMELRGSTGRRS